MTNQISLLRPVIEFFSVLLAFIAITENVHTQEERFEISLSPGYSKPQLEAWGKSMDYDYSNQIVTIDGKRIFNSDNLAMNSGFTIQAYGKYKILKSGKLKGVLNLGFTQLEGSQMISTGLSFGVLMSNFSLGAGIEANPLGTNRFYPSIFLLFRMNEILGESFYYNKLDYFPMATRFGYVYGLNLNYRVAMDFAISFGSSFSYDNWLNKQSDPGAYSDPRESNFVDQATAQNGLSGPRRIGYISFNFGVNYYIK